MTNAKTTKRALLSSVMALFICFAMLLGTTYAWFTDSVASANNIIQAGNLDIILEYYDTESQEWKDVKDSDDILTGDLWEPGYVDVAYLRIKNNGSLALKYALSVNIISETEGINSKGDKFLLSDYIYFDVVNDKQPTFENRDAAMATVDSATKISSGYSESGSLAVGSDFVYLAMVVYMPTTVDNVANHNGVDIPQIDLGINIFATQDTVEPDSFGPDYDKDNAVYTVAEANAWLAQNKDVTLVGCNEPDGILYIPADYTGTLTIANAKIKSVQAAGNANIVILGSVVVNANGSGVSTVAETEFDGSAITANGELKISGTGKLTAIAADVKGAFGIGGMNTTKLTIENVHILEAKGSFAQPGITSDYGKKDPEGGAAIGSGYSGAVITLNNVIVDNAQGGSKAAAIGARYWTGVTININNSIIKNAIGGSNSAGIGGSRVSSGATSAESITINIVKSNVTAIGGDYGAGIGSGYSTYLVPESDSRPVYTINIDEASVIKATGGVAAAGIGTGHNVVGLAGEIKSTNVTATAGQATCPAPNFNCCYGRLRSNAQDIGFGSLADEIIFKPITQTITYLGEKIAIPSVSIIVTSQEDLAKAIADGVTDIKLAAGNYTMPEPNLRDKSLTIRGTKDTVIDATAVNANDQFVTGATIVFDGVTLNFGNKNYMGFANTASLTYKNCQINGLQFLYGDNVTFENCDLNSNGAEHCVWTYGAKNVTFTDCDFTYGDRGINCYKDQDIAGGKQTVNFTNCTFTTENAASEGAVEINSSAFSVGIEVNMEGCTAPAYGKMAYVSRWDSTNGAKTTINIK